MLLVGVCAGLTVRQARMPAENADTWFHLRMGQEFLDGWSVSSPGHLGVFDTAEWVATQWLAQIGMAQTYDLLGVAGVVWVAALIHCTISLTLYLVCRREFSALAAIAATLVGWLAIAPGLSARPQVFSYLAFVALVLAWRGMAADGRPRWWLIPLIWLWVPLHGMWVLGIIATVVMTVGTWLDRRPDRRSALALAAVPAAQVVVSFLTPVGWGAYEALFSVGSRAAYFTEWQSPNLLSGTNLAAVTMLVVALAVRLTSREAYGWTDTLMLLLAVAFAIYSTRTVPVAAILLAPLFASALQRFLPTVGPATRLEKWSATGLVAAAMVVLAFMLPSRTETLPVPAWVDQELSALPSGTPVLSSWNTGTYFLWSQPQLDLVMHGYGDVFTDEEIQRNFILFGVGQGWRDELADLDAEYAVVETGTHFAQALSEEAGWSVVKEDDRFRVLTAPTP